MQDVGNLSRLLPVNSLTDMRYADTEWDKWYEWDPAIFDDKTTETIDQAFLDDWPDDFDIVDPNAPRLRTEVCELDSETIIAKDEVYKE